MVAWRLGMSPTYVKLESQLLTLPVEARARLAERLIASLGTVDPEKTEAYLLDEVERRAAEHRREPGSGIPAERAFRDALALIKSS